MERPGGGPPAIPPGLRHLWVALGLGVVAQLALGVSAAVPIASWAGLLLLVASSGLIVAATLRLLPGARLEEGGLRKRLVLPLLAFGLFGTLAARLGAFPWIYRQMIQELVSGRGDFQELVGPTAATGLFETMAGASFVAGLMFLARPLLPGRVAVFTKPIVLASAALLGAVAAGRALLLAGEAAGLEAALASGDKVAAAAILYPLISGSRVLGLALLAIDLILLLVLVSPALLTSRDADTTSRSTPAEPAHAPTAGPRPLEKFLDRLLGQISAVSMLGTAIFAGIIATIVFWGATSDLLQGLFMGSVYALIALGYTMVYGVLKMINFAHGDVFMWGAFWVYLFSAQLGVSFIVACFAGALLCALMGVVIERVAYRPLRKASRLAPLITAIGVSLFLEAASQLSFGAGTKRIVPVDSPAANLGTTTFSMLGDKVVVDHRDLLILGVTIVVMVALHLIVKYTKTGKAMRAVADDMDSARAVGIDVNRIISTTFAIGSIFAAIGGILFALRFAADPYMGILPGIKAFTAAVVGGIGNIYGAMLGGILLGLAEFVGSWGLGQAGLPFATAYRDAIAFVILIIVLLFKPSGLFGREHLTLSRRK